MRTTTQTNTTSDAALTAALAACGTPITDEPAVRAAAERTAAKDAVAAAAERQRDDLDAATRGTGDGASDAAALDAIEHLPGARIAAARARREANAEKAAYDETVAAVRQQRGERLDEAERATRERILASGEAFYADIVAGHTIDRLRHELMTADERWVNAMVPGGAFAKLAIVHPEQLRARLDALRALDD